MAPLVEASASLEALGDGWRWHYWDAGKVEVGERAELAGVCPSQESSVGYGHKTGLGAKWHTVKGHRETKSRVNILEIAVLGTVAAFWRGECRWK